MSSDQVVPESVVFRRGRAKTRVVYYRGETLLETARRSNISLSSSCENGDCGTCMVELLKGQVYMRQNNALDETDLEQGCVLACQAVPVSDSIEVEIY